MITSEFKDTDGYKLRFSEKSSEADKKYFRQKYSKVDAVASEKLHCTTCDMHIGTAPISEKIVRTHMILSVTQCNKCFAFYNSGEFGKGEDGSEYYCRWCGQGGEVFCCATCPFVFCNKCIKSNLSNSYVKEIEENDDWSCFVCNKDILKNQRAQHWALRNFMTKQLEKIQKTTVQSEDELSNLLNEDASNCCPRKKRKTLLPKPVAPAAPVKRSAGSMIGGGMIAYPPAKRISAEIKLPQKPAPASKSGNNQSSIVCTPDILGLLNGENETPQPSTSVAPPPPLVMRNNQRVRLPPASTVAATPAAAGTPPIYHNISGFQIDLNHAARQEIFRLPNGKLIQVRKQAAATPPPNGANIRSPGNVNIRGPQFTIRQANSPAANILNNFIRPVRPQGPQHGGRPRQPNQQQPRFTTHNGRMVASPIQPTPVALPAPKPSGSTIFTQQNGTISVARAPQPETPFGKAKIAFEDKIINGLEICQHTINKMITLSNNTSFKESRTFSDLKDLYIHLQYLFSFTGGKIKTLQEDLTAGMGSLESIDTASKEKTTTDELEILEEKTDVIEVLSDDDEPAPPKVKAEVVSPPKAAAPATIAYAPGPLSAIKKPLIKHIQYTAKDIVPVPVVVEPTVRIPLNRDSVDSAHSDHLNDKKLKAKTLVKVEKLEDSKNVVIKQFIKQLKERLEASSESGESSREGTPDWTLQCLETMITKDEDPAAKPIDQESEKESRVLNAETGEMIDDASETTEDATEVNDLSASIKDATDKVEDATANVEDSTEKVEDSTEKVEDSTEKVEDSTKKIEAGAVNMEVTGENTETEVLKAVESEKPEESDALKIGSAPPVDLMDISDDSEVKLTENRHKSDETAEIPDDEDDLAEEVIEAGEAKTIAQKDPLEVTKSDEEKVEETATNGIIDPKSDEVGDSSEFKKVDDTPLISEMASDSHSVEFVSESRPAVSTTLTEVTDTMLAVKEVSEAVTEPTGKADHDPNIVTLDDSFESVDEEAKDSEAVTEPTEKTDHEPSIVMLDDSFESVNDEAKDFPIHEDPPKTEVDDTNKIAETVDDELGKCLEASTEFNLDDNFLINDSLMEID